MGSSSDDVMRYPCPSSVNVANFVTVSPWLQGHERNNNFKIWKKQMLCLLRSQDMMGFVNGKILPPPLGNVDEQELWRRSDELVQGWILGSIGKDALEAVWEKPTARDIWLELDHIFKQQQQQDDDSSSGDFSRYWAVYQAALRGDWDAAKNFFPDINQLCTTIISSYSETALHVAVSTGKANDFVKKLVEITPPDTLALASTRGSETALHYAAAVGNTAAAVTLVNKNPDLIHICDKLNQLPVLIAALGCHRETLKYLISKHEAANPERSPFQGEQGINLLIEVILSEYVDIALDLAHKYPSLTLLTSQGYGGKSALSAIAETEDLFPTTDGWNWWQKFIYHRIPLNKCGFEVAGTHEIEVLSSNAYVSAHRNRTYYSTSFHTISQVGQKLECVIWDVIENLVPKVKEVREKKVRRRQALELAEYLCHHIVSELPEKQVIRIFHPSIMCAASRGISEIVEMIIRKFPIITFQGDASGMNIFMMAANLRYENVINLLYNMSDRRYVFFDHIDNKRNNLLHICGRLAPPNRLNLVAGAALQMQRELHWFKEMENFVSPARRIWWNAEQQTPQVIFTKEHANLKADGERWMKDTANACTIAAALIATVVFAAAFTVPGGVDSATGIPLLSRRPSFGIFLVSDAISMFTSVTSLLMFLSILTSRYAEEDFLYTLPSRLSMGLVSLFVSIIFMLVAFSAALYLLLQTDRTWFLIIFTSFACLPVTCFVLLQFPLLVDVVYSTYGPGIFGKKTDRILY